MDRYVIREQRSGAGNPHPNQIIGFNQVGSSSSSSTNNITWFEPENIVYGGYGPDLSNVQRFCNKGVILQNPGHIMSGIDPRYLPAYSNNSASYITPGPQNFSADQNNFTPEASDVVYYSDYMNKNFVGPEKPTKRMYANKQQFSAKEQFPRNVVLPKQSTTYGSTSSSTLTSEVKLQKSVPMPLKDETRKPVDTAFVKKDAQNLVKMRFDKLKALNKSGPRAFSGPVEKVLKWHKILQDVGILILYEIVAKCVSVRAGDSCAKILVIRDENGPAMQVVYYEIDFLLPNLKLPCMVRVVGRMVRGTSRLQAFRVRAATGDDVVTLPRRAAIADQHAAKLAKEYRD